VIVKEFPEEITMCLNGLDGQTHHTGNECEWILEEGHAIKFKKQLFIMKENFKIQYMTTEVGQLCRLPLCNFLYSTPAIHFFTC
jgi:hypothetical protein